MKKVMLLAAVILVGCLPSEEETIQGIWQAKWTTDPVGYGELAGELKFEMDGLFDFEEDQLTISAYGYAGCVFGVDTLSHTLTWQVSGDTLALRNTSDELGIKYKILNQTHSKIKLQLLEDIFITLSK